MNRFLRRHPNVGALAFVGGIVGLIVIGGKAADFVAENPGVLAIFVAVFVLLMMALAGNRHFS